MKSNILGALALVIGLLACVISGLAQSSAAPQFKVIASYTGKNDLAHISFVHEAHAWFPKMADQYHFPCEASTNWSDLNAEFLSHYQVVLFLDTRPDVPAQRAAFQ